MKRQGHGNKPRCNASQTRRTVERKPALHYAAAVMSPEAVKAVIGDSGDLEQHSDDGLTPLQTAAVWEM